MYVHIYIYTHIYIYLSTTLINTTSELPKNPTAQYTTPRTSSFFGAHNSFDPAGAMIQRLAILAVHLSYVCAAFGNKKVVGPKPHIWQNKNSNDTQDHFTRTSPEIEFESVGVVVTVAVVTGNSGAPLLSIFR